MNGPNQSNVTLDYSNLQTFEGPDRGTALVAVT
jgi:hypothetical protein